MTDRREVPAGARLFHGFCTLGLMYCCVVAVFGMVVTARDGSYGFTAICAALAVVTGVLSWTGVRWFRRTKGV